MTDQRKEGDPVPEGSRLMGINEAAAQALGYGVALRMDTLSSDDVGHILDAWRRNFEASDAETTALLLLALANLAAGPLLRLAKLEDSNPFLLIEAESIVMDAFADSTAGEQL